MATATSLPPIPFPSFVRDTGQLQDNIATAERRTSPSHSRKASEDGSSASRSSPRLVMATSSPSHTTENRRIPSTSSNTLPRSRSRSNNVSEERSPLTEISPTNEHSGSASFDVGPLIAHLDTIALERGKRRRKRTSSSSRSNSARSPRLGSNESTMLEFVDLVSDFRIADDRQTREEGAEDQDGDGGKDYLTPIGRGSIAFPGGSETVTSSPNANSAFVTRTPRTSSLYINTELQSHLIRSQSIGGGSINLIDFNSPGRKSLDAKRISTGGQLSPRPASILGSSAEMIPFPTSISTQTSMRSDLTQAGSSTVKPHANIEIDEEAQTGERDMTSDMDSEEALESEEEEDLTDDEEDEDPDSHPLYVLLSSSSIPVLRSAWDAATLILVPPRRTLPSFAPLLPKAMSAPAFEFIRGGKGVQGEQAGRDVEREKQILAIYVALHAFKPIPSIDGGAVTMWRSVAESVYGYCRARLVPEQGVAIVEWIDSSSGSDSSVAPTSTSAVSLKSSTSGRSFPSVVRPRTLRIIAETTIYRRPRPPPVVPASSPPPPTLSKVLTKPMNSNKSAFRTPKWFRRSTSSIPTLRTLPEKADLDSPVSSTIIGSSSKGGPMLERVRVLALGASVVTQLDEALDSQNTPRKIGLASRSSSSERDLVLRNSNSSHSLRMSSLSRTASLSSSAMKSRSQTNLLSRHPTFDLPPPRTSEEGSITGCGRKRAGSVASTRSARSTKSFATNGPTHSAMLRRDFLSDLAFLASPPAQLAGLAPAFHMALSQIRSLVREFEGGVAYIRGLEAYLVQRIRKGILDRVWQQIVRELDSIEDLRAWLMSDDHAATLKLLVENVIIGLLYRKLYTSSILPLYAQEDEMLQELCSVYRERNFSPSEFGVELSGLGDGNLLLPAIEILQDLKDTSATSKEVPIAVAQLWARSATSINRSPKQDPLSPNGSSAIEAEGDDPSVTRSLRGVRTPLSCITIIASALQEMVSVIEALQSGTRLAPDDLIPLFAWVIVRSGVENLESLLFFAKTFRLSETIASHLDWSFVNFQAALAFLLSDPLQSLPEPPMPGSNPSLNFGPSSASSSPARHGSMSDLGSHRDRRLSLQQHRTTNTVSPPGSPSSGRVVGFPWTSPSASSAKTPRDASSSPSSSPWSGYAREHRLSWQQATKAPNHVSLTLGAESVASVKNLTGLFAAAPRFDRLSSSEEMPPPTWTSATERKRMSLSTSGHGSSSSLGEYDSAHELGEDSHPESTATCHLKSLSMASGSSEGATHDNRPRIVVHTRPSHLNRNHDRSNSPASPSLARSHSAIAPRGAEIGSSSLSSLDMRRSESEGSSVTANRPNQDRWSLWGALPSLSSSSNPPFNRAASPSFSDNTSGEGALSSDDHHSSSWWAWRRGNMLSSSVGPSFSSSQLAEPTAPTMGATASSELLRIRRYSASAAEILADRPPHLDHTVENVASSSSARLAAILATKGSISDMLPPARPRPRSIMSVSSIGSNASFVLSEPEEAALGFNVPTSSPLLSSPSATSMYLTSAPTVPRRRATRSRTWRELPTSNLAGAPLAPRLDSTSIVSLPRTSSSSMLSSLGRSTPPDHDSRSPSDPLSGSLTPELTAKKTSSPVYRTASLDLPRTISLPI